MRFHRLGLALVPLCAAVQVALCQRPLEARVIDAASSEPLPFASVIALHSGPGVITNAEGVFRLPSVDDTDSLVITFLGYQRLRIAVSRVRAQHDVGLTATRTELATVQVDGRSDAVYDLVVQAGKHLRATGRYGGKVYYELETRTGDRPVEAIECYYNGRFNGADIEALELKQGRVGLLADHGRYVVNLNTSRGFMLLHPAEHNSAFPDTPLQYRSRSALRKAFDLTVVSIGQDDDALYQVQFKPKGDTAGLFRGELWIDAGTATVRSVRLACDDCKRHPFEPLVPGDALQDLSLRYGQTYVPWKGRSILNTVEMAYALTYHGGEQDTRMAMQESGIPRDRRMWTTGILHVFDPDKAFILPVFTYETEQTDYWKVLAMPYDSVFWTLVPGLVPTARQRSDQDLFARDGLLLAGKRKLGEQDRDRRGFFESNYAFWSPAVRITLKDLDPQGLTPPQARTAEVVADQVHPVAQLFLNIDEVAGGYRVFSATVFDGFRSYCRLGEQQHPELLLNLFFDLCEIERRRMQTRLEAPGATLASIRAIHAEAQSHMERTGAALLRETHHGADMKALARWNETVRSALGVDNFRMLGFAAAEE